MTSNLSPSSLLVLAAGMGSRYGGLKQVDPVGPNAEALMDYSIYDAIEAGFTKVVFLIREEMKDIFDEQIGSRYLDLIDVQYAFQKLEDLPAGVEVPVTRSKPWGTGHAVWCARDVLKDSNFSVINADDFYSHDAYVKAKQMMRHVDFQNYGMIAYKLENTLSKFGGVSRGICNTHDNELLDVKEHLGIKFHDKIITCDQKNIELDGTQLVSMNLWILNPSVFSHLKKVFEAFYNVNKNSRSEELFLPTVINDLMMKENLSVRVIPTDASWFGLTYEKDLDQVKTSISLLINRGEYPPNIEL